MQNIICKYCGSTRIKRKGFRKIKAGKTDVYQCKKCARKFSLSPLPTYAYLPEAILTAPVLYYSGYSLPKTHLLISRRFKIKPSVSTVYGWIKKFGKYSGLKEQRKNIQKFDTPSKIISRKLFIHQQNYLFQLHHYKLSLVSDSLNGIKDYLADLLTGKMHIAPEKYVHRASTLIQDISLSFPAPRKTYACAIAAIALKAAKTNFHRHAMLEKFFIATDKATIACEVPVFLEPDEMKGIFNVQGGILGHIDFLQVYGNNITILDYKPEASKQKHVPVQLLFYAIGLSIRAGIHLKHIYCSWFDEYAHYSVPSMEIYSHLRRSSNIEQLN